ncbi:MAG: c-type cytochrome, partial [Anaerolineae bacterium]
MMKRSQRVLSIMCLLFLPVFVSACSTAPAASPTAVPPSPTPLAAVAQSSSSSATQPAAQPGAPTGEITGAPLFELSCAACHGQNHAGTTFDMDGQKIDVPSLAWSELSSTYSADASRGTVEQQVALGITKGLDETGGDLNAMMPHWSSLSQAQVDSLVQFLKAADTSSAEAPTLTPDAASLTGAQLYAAACA